MATGTNRGVGIRLFVAGADVVKRGFNDVADSGRKMWAQIALGEKAANPAIVALSRASSEAQGAVGGLADRVGGAGRVLGAFGAAGVATSAALGALTIAATQATQAMDFGDTLEAQAAKIGTSVTALQQYRDAALAADVSNQDIDSSLSRLNVTLGAFKTGVGDAKVKEAFGALGFTPEQLAGMESATEFLPVLADRISQVADKSDRMKYATMLGVADALPFLELGSKRIRDLMQEADDAGRVIDEGLIHRLADLDREMEKTDARLQTASTTFFSKFAPALVAAKDALADLMTAAVAVPDELDRISTSADTGERKFWSMATAVDAFVYALKTIPGAGQVGGWIAGVFTGKAAPDAPGFPLSAEAAARIGNGQSPRAVPGSATPPPGGKPPRGGGGRAKPVAAAKAFTGKLPPEVLAAIADERMTEAEARKSLADLPADRPVLVYYPIEVSRGETPDQISARTALGDDAIAAPDTSVDFSAGSPDLVRGPLGGLMTPEEKEGWARDIGDATAQGLDAALNGDFDEFLRNRLYNAALDGLSSAVTDALKNADLGGGAGGIFSDIGSWALSLFGGGRAAGGGVGSGMWVNAGEHGRTELAMIGGNGYVADHDATKRMIREAVGGAGYGYAGGGHQTVTIISKLEIPAGYVSDQGLGNLFSQAHRAAVAEAVATSQAAAPGASIDYQFQKG